MIPMAMHVASRMGIVVGWSSTTNDHTNMACEHSRDLWAHLPSSYSGLALVLSRVQGVQYDPVMHVHGHVPVRPD